MDTTIHLMARSVQIAVITAPTSSLHDAVTSARGPRESLVTLIRRAFAATGRSPMQAGG
jgi:glycerol dehydrogenase-like iron-containing ADH family enzyme